MPKKISISVVDAPKWELDLIYASVYFVGHIVLARTKPAVTA